MKRLVEAALFVSTEPLSIDDLCRNIDINSRKHVEEAIRMLRKDYADRESALEIIDVGNRRYAMQVKDEFNEKISKLVKPLLSQGVLKTLSLIALKQPVTQAEIVKSLGFTTYSHIRELESKNFIFCEPKGRTKVITTTQKFSDFFSIPSSIVKSEDIKAIPNFLTEQLVNRE